MRRNKTPACYRSALPKPLWALVLLLDMAIFLLGSLAGRIDLIVLAFVLTLLIDQMGRRGLLGGYRGLDESENSTGRVLTMTKEQKRELVDELRAQRKARRVQRKKGEQEV